MPLENLKGIDDFAKIDVQWIDEKSDRLARECAEAKLTTHQIRNIFSAVNRIRVLWKKTEDFEKISRELILLKPKLAYQVGRMDKENERKALKSLKDELDKAIDAVRKSQNKEQALANFFAFVESIVAYHRFYSRK